MYKKTLNKTVMADTVTMSNDKCGVIKGYTCDEIKERETSLFKHDQERCFFINGRILDERVSNQMNPCNCGINDKVCRYKTIGYHKRCFSLNIFNKLNIFGRDYCAEVTMNDCISRPVMDFTCYAYYEIIWDTLIRRSFEYNGQIVMSNQIDYVVRNVLMPDGRYFKLNRVLDRRCNELAVQLPGLIGDYIVLDNHCYFYDTLVGYKKEGIAVLDDNVSGRMIKGDVSFKFQEYKAEQFNTIPLCNADKYNVVTRLETPDHHSSRAFIYCRFRNNTYDFRFIFHDICIIEWRNMGWYVHSQPVMYDTSLDTAIITCGNCDLSYLDNAVVASAKLLVESCYDNTIIKYLSFLISQDDLYVLLANHDMTKKISDQDFNNFKLHRGSVIKTYEFIQRRIKLGALKLMKRKGPYYDSIMSKFKSYAASLASDLSSLQRYECNSHCSYSFGIYDFGKLYIDIVKDLRWISESFLEHVLSLKIYLDYDEFDLFEEYFIDINDYM